MRRLAILFAVVALSACVSPHLDYRPPENATWEMKLRALRGKSGKSLLRDSDIHKLRDIGARYDEVERMLAMRSMDGAQLFDGTSLTWFLETGGDSTYAKTMAGFLRWSPFDGYDIAELHALGAELDWVRALTKNAGCSCPTFQPDEVIAYAKAGGTIEYVRRASWAFLFYRRDLSGGHLVRTFAAGATPQQIADLVAIRNEDGLSPFGGSEFLVRFIELGGTPEYAQRLSSFHGSLLVRFLLLGLSAEEASEFRDTDRPNALVLYPFSDYNGEFENEASVRLFQQVKQAYDMQVRVMLHESQLQVFIDELPQIDLLWIAGHGTVSSIPFIDTREFIRIKILSGNFSFSMRNIDEEIEPYQLDTQDHDLAAVFSRLAPDATIFLDACDCGKPRAGLPNLAQFVSTLAPGRNVVAADYAFTHDEVRVVSLVPLRLEFVRP